MNAPRPRDRSGKTSPSSSPSWIGNVGYRSTNEDRKPSPSSDDPNTLKASLKPPASLQGCGPGAFYACGYTTYGNEVPRKPIYVEIAPGLKTHLRGYEETKACVGRDFFLPCLCYSCTMNLFCIMDANYVICPVCRVVSPLEGGADLDYRGGVGLGFTLNDLAAWQIEFWRNYDNYDNNDSSFHSHNHI